MPAARMHRLLRIRQHMGALDSYGEGRCRRGLHRIPQALFVRSSYEDDGAERQESLLLALS
eukprot:1874687-Alexandrium_andersonii.AAC.1